MNGIIFSPRKGRKIRRFKSVVFSFFQFTFPGLLGGAANKLDAAEDVNAAREEHGEGAELHAAITAGTARGRVPLIEVPAFCLVVNVIKETVLGHQEGVRLEGAL